MSLICEMTVEDLRFESELLCCKIYVIKDSTDSFGLMIGTVED